MTSLHADRRSILIVEDDSAMAELETRALQRAGRRSHTVGNGQEAIAALSRDAFAAVLLDYRLPDGEAWPVLDAALAQVPAVPVIVVTAMGDERVAAEVLSRGGAGYFIKSGDFLEQLPAAVMRVLDGVEAKQALARLAAIVESSDDAIIGTSLEGDILTWNSGAERTYGYTAAEIVGRHLAVLVPTEHVEEIANQLAEIGRGGRFSQFETVHLTRGRERIDISVTLSPIVDANGRPCGVSVIARDISQLKRAEEALVEKACLAALAADVGVAQTRGEPLRATLAKCAEAIVEHLDAAFARIWTLDDAGQMLELQASAGMYTHIDGPYGRVPVGKFKIGLIAEERLAHLTNDVYHDPRVGDREWAKREGIVSFAGYPLMVEGELVGVMAMFARRPLTEFTLHGLETVADTVALGIRRKKVEEAQGKLQEQLRQAQKIEAIGQLAGGIAHDFNNLLTVVLGYCDLLHRKLGIADPRGGDVEEIRKAASRAASLTQQLLAFSRQQVLQPRVLDLNQTITGVERMLSRLIGEDIELYTVLCRDLGRVKADPGQLEQVLMNLVINARDAMPEGGKLTIETRNVSIDGATYGQDAIKPGRYVMIAVSDTGTGMDEATKKRLFEPFFTTKEPGKGTGLGLATVYGIVKQSGGHIWVYSELGKGSAFKIYLPSLSAPEDVAPSEIKMKGPARGSETVLLVEDEALVRNLAVEILHEFGYSVLVAAKGEDALRMSETHAGPIDILLTDVVMPGGSGREWAERILGVRPEMKVLYMSGYTDTAIVERGLLNPGIAFIQKPFTPAALTQKIREVLAAS